MDGWGMVGMDAWHWMDECLRLDGWMEVVGIGWMVGWMVGFLDEWLEKWLSGMNDGWRDEWMEAWVNGSMEGLGDKADCLMNEGMDGGMDRWVVDPWTDVREKGHGGIKGDWMEGSTGGWVDRHMGGELDGSRDLWQAGCPNWLTKG